MYSSKSNLITTSISGGRQHFGHRLPVKAIKTYPYELSYGENFFTLSTLIFGEDKFWWVLADINKPMDTFALHISKVVNLPEKLVKDVSGVTKFV